MYAKSCKVAKCSTFLGRRKSREGLKSQHLEFKNRLNQYFNVKILEYTEAYLFKKALCVTVTLYKDYGIFCINAR